MILALLQLENGRMYFGSRSFLSPRTGLRKTATRSELDVSGARSPTKMLYSFWNCCCCGVVPGGYAGAENAGEFELADVGTELAQLRTKGLDELGIWTGFPTLLIWARTAAACACDGKVKKQ